MEQYFAQLYADTHPEREPMTAGRQMNGHFGSRTVDGRRASFLPLTKQPNSSVDLSPTASQMPRSVWDWLMPASITAHCGKAMKKAGLQGQRVLAGWKRGGLWHHWRCASTSEGMFWETMNAAAVLGVPLVHEHVWDDGYGISVPKKYQTARESISQALGRDGLRVRARRRGRWGQCPSPSPRPRCLEGAL